MSAGTNFYDTIVVGAGFGGASTAYNLIENGYKGKVLVLEARDRIGGRAYGQVLAGQHVEFGCNWIHGLEKNPILDLAVKYKVVDLSKDKPDPIILQPDVPGFTQDGERVPKEIVQVAFDAYTKIMDKANGFYERVKKGEQIEEMPLGQYVDEEIHKFLATRPEAERPLLRAVLNQMVVGEAQLNGTNSLYDISLKYYGLYKTIPGGDLFISRGFGRVIQGMIDDVTRKTNDTDQFKLLLNHEVAKIKWNGAEANSQEPVEVTCENGAVFKGRHLVNSMPLGVLQAKAKAIYEPALPKDKTDIISAFNYGDGYISKMYLEYDEALTPRFIDSSLGDWIMIYFKLPEEVENEVKKQTNLAKHWPKKVHSIKKVNDRLLSVWLSGKETVYVEKLDEKVLSKEITSLLRSVFGKAEFPEPKRIVSSQWASSPYTNGSYTSMKFGATDKDLEQLRQPIFAGNDKKPVLLFVGEAMHPLYYSTTHAAYLSGEKAASDLLD